MFQTLVYIAGCLAPFGVFVWSMKVESARKEAARQKNRDRLEPQLKR
jgi:hypothetical protein